MPVHATVAELVAWTGEAAPANAAQLLRSASLLIDRETVTAVYAVNRDTGRATDTAVLDALRDATSAQAATWAALGVDPVKGAADTSGAKVRTSLGSGTIEYDPATVTAARAQAATELAPEAAQILAAAGLLSPRVWAHG